MKSIGLALEDSKDFEESTLDVFIGFGAGADEKLFCLTWQKSAGCVEQGVEVKG